MNKLTVECACNGHYCDNSLTVVDEPTTDICIIIHDDDDNKAKIWLNETAMELLRRTLFNLEIERMQPMK